MSHVTDHRFKKSCFGPDRRHADDELHLIRVFTELPARRSRGPRRVSCRGRRGSPAGTLAHVTMSPQGHAECSR